MATTKAKLKTVMLIDDNEIDNLINEKMLQSADFCENIMVYSGAKSALEYLRNVEKVFKGEESYIPEMIFLDIDMPLVDGFQFMDEFEKLSDIIKGKTAVVMLTSSMNPQDVSTAKQNRLIKKYINKPLTADAIEKLRSEMATKVMS